MCSVIKPGKVFSMYYVQYIRNNVQYTRYNNKLYNGPGILYWVQRTWYYVNCTINSVSGTVSSVQGVLYSVQCTLLQYCNLLLPVQGWVWHLWATAGHITALRCGADWCSVVQYCSLPGRQPKGSLLIGSSLVSVQCSVHGCLASREGCTPHRLGHSPTIPSHFAGSLYQISITLLSLVTIPTLFMFYPAISEKCSFYQIWPLAALQILLLL